MTELKDWLQLLRAPGLGARRLHPLIKHFGSATAVIGAGGALRDFGVTQPAMEALTQPDRTRLDADLQWLSEPNHHLVTFASNDFPPQLRQMPDPPAALFVVGDPTLMWLPQLAIVGSRNASRGGLDNARGFAQLIASQGLTVTSGLALGVDGAAHAGALAANGPTIAVAATGLDRVYPAKHRDLATKIAENGAIVSEFPLGTEPRPGHFPARNRIISGLSLGVLVVEASLGSGSLITARQAIEQGREVFAIPGSIHNPMARGCHQLIKQGAKLVESGEDLYDELKASLAAHVALAGDRLGTPVEAVSVEPTGGEPNNEQNEDYKKLLEAIGYDPVSIDRLVELTELPIDALSSMLLILELDGKVQNEPGGGYYRCGRQAGPAAASGVTT